MGKSQIVCQSECPESPCGTSADATAWQLESQSWNHKAGITKLKSQSWNHKAGITKLESRQIHGTCINDDDLLFGTPIAIDDPANVWFLPPAPMWYVVGQQRHDDYHPP
jgi:hypothetical protein